MNTRHLLALAALLGAVSTANAQSVWLPSPGELVATPGFTFSTFDEFWVGGDMVSPLKDNDESLDQYVAYVALEYGFTESLAIDGALGYTWTSSTDVFGGSDDGLADTSIGLRYRFLEEGEWTPAFAIRVGGIIAGTYDENTPFSAGDGANAIEGSILFGKEFGDTGFGVYGDLGYRFREDPVPDDLFGSIGLFKRFTDVSVGGDALTLACGYRHIESRDGLDIGGPGFDPSRGASHGFPALREINQLIEGSLAYTDMGGRTYQVGVARSVDGRNTGDKTVVFFVISLAFGG